MTLICDYFLIQGSYRQVRVKSKDFSRTSKILENRASPTVFIDKDLKLMKNSDLSVKILLQKC